MEYLGKGDYFGSFDVPGLQRGPKIINESNEFLSNNDVCRLSTNERKSTIDRISLQPTVIEFRETKEGNRYVICH